jgi:hypothetical protein
VRVAGWLLLGMIAGGVLLAVAGVVETSFLKANLPVIEEKSTFLSEAMNSWGRMRDSSTFARGLGVFDAAGALLLLWPVGLRGLGWARIAGLVYCGVAILCHVVLLVQDGAVGIHPYMDMSHDMAQEQLINSLIVAPGYFAMLYPAESLGLILPILIGWNLLQDSTVEYVQRRRKATPDRTWDVAEILAKRQKGVS